MQDTKQEAQHLAKLFAAWLAIQGKKRKITLKL